jgi:hypothetical protein
LGVHGDGRGGLDVEAPCGTWSAENSTLVVPMDGAVRLQFQFQDDPP